MPIPGATSQHIVFLCEGSIGDSFVAIPTLNMLFRRFPQSKISLISVDASRKLNAAAILGGRFPFYKTLHVPVETKGMLGRLDSLLRWGKIARWLRKEKVTTCFYGFRAEGEDFLRRASLHRRLLKASGANVLGTDADPGPLKFISEQPNAVHAAIGKTLFKRACEAFGLNEADEAFDFLYPFQQEELDRADLWLESNQLKQTPFYILCCTAKAKARMWEVDRYLECAQFLLSSKGLVPVLVGGPEDEALHLDFISKLGAGVRAKGLTFVDEVALTKRASYYLGNNTGPMHIAAATGIPCYAIFSASTPNGQWDPLGPGHHVFRTDAPCAGCELSVCNVQPENFCMKQITSGEVISFFESLRY